MSHTKKVWDGFTLQGYMGGGEKEFYMQLTMTTDYALRCLLYLAGKEGVSSSPEIGKAVGINNIFVQKVLRVLRDAGFVSSLKGGTGGYWLANKPEEIVLLDIILLFEKTMKINRCLEAEGCCERYETCPMHVYYAEVQETLEGYFGQATLQDVINHGKIKRKEMIDDAKEKACDRKNSM